MGVIKSAVIDYAEQHNISTDQALDEMEAIGAAISLEEFMANYDPENDSLIYDPESEADYLASVDEDRYQQEQDR